MVPTCGGRDLSRVGGARLATDSILECFVHAEIAKAAALSDETTTVGLP